MSTRATPPAGNASAETPRRTKQRAELQAVLEGRDHFLTAQQIHQLIRDAGASVGLATVYRTVQQMAGAGELDTLRMESGDIGYRQCSPSHHHHLVCTGCGRTVEVSAPPIEEWARAVAGEHGFVDARHEVELFGVCADCAARASRAE